MIIAVVREDLRFADKALNDLADFFRLANIREAQGITFYQYLLCPEYFDAKQAEMKGSNCDSLH